MTQVEEMREAQFGLLCRLMPELVQRLSWSRERIDAHRTMALRSLLTHVRAHSRWHGPRLAHLDPATATLDDLARLPTMTKNDLMENWDDIVTVPGATLAQAQAALRDMTDQFYIWGDHTLLTSGGTGGRPGIFLYDWTSLTISWAGMARGIEQYADTLPQQGCPNPPKRRVAAMGAEPSGHGSFVTGRIFDDPNNRTHRLSGWRAIADHIATLNAVQPEYLLCYPSLIPALAAAARAGYLKISPEGILCGGEHFSDASRELVRQTWPQSHVRHCWGTSEGGGTFPCPLGDGFHVSEDLVIIEPVDGNGAPTAPGERSAGVYFTNLYNLSMPIIRYYIDDVFEMDDKPCPCGSQHQKVRQVHGREFESFRYKAATVHPVTLQLAVLEQPQIVEYQFRQTPNGAHLCYRCNGNVDAGRLSERMRDALLSYGLQDPDVTVEEVAYLERTKAGKLKRFVPLTP